MAVDPDKSEASGGPWTALPIDSVARLLLPAVSTQTRRPVVVAVDGRSGSGKTTFARRLVSRVDDASVVHTDDVAWYHAFFDWAELLRAGVLEPLRRGSSVSYRPPAWDERGRQGAIEVPQGRSLVIVEGVGVARRSLRRWFDHVVWVEADLELARKRGIARDGGTQDVTAFWDEWASYELPFLDAERPWQHARLIVAGTPSIAHDPENEVVVRRG